MDMPAICNGCGNESAAWNKLCNDCDQKVTCQGCSAVYKRGHGLQEVNLCSTCLQEVFARQDEEEEEIFHSKKAVRPPTDVTENPHEEHGFDYQWELYDR